MTFPQYFHMQCKVIFHVITSSEIEIALICFHDKINNGSIEVTRTKKYKHQAC